MHYRVCEDHRNRDAFLFLFVVGWVHAVHGNDAAASASEKHRFLVLDSSIARDGRGFSVLKQLKWSRPLELRGGAFVFVGTTTAGRLTFGYVIMRTHASNYSSDPSLVTVNAYTFQVMYAYQTVRTSVCVANVYSCMQAKSMDANAFG